MGPAGGPWGLLKSGWPRVDRPRMYINTGLFTTILLLAAGIALVLYIMRRRVRLGRRKPTI